MSVPSFSDLGKSARDVFRTGFHYGKSLIKFGAKANTTNLNMNSDLQLNCDTSQLDGVVGTEYKTGDYGNFLQRWTLDGTVTLGYNLYGAVISDVGLFSEVSYNPQSRVKAVKVGAKCSKEAFNTMCSIASDMQSNVNILGSLVTVVKGLLIGYQGGYDSESNRMTKNDVGLAFEYQDVGFHFRCTSIPHEYGLSLLYKVNPDWDTAINGIMAVNGGIQNWTFGAAAKCNIDSESTLRFKLNTDFQLGMSLQQRLDSNVLLTLSFNVDCANITRGGHKVGLAIEVDA